MTTHTISGDQGTKQYKPDLPDGAVVDCTGASWVVDKEGVTGTKQTNPVSIRDATDVTVFGGTIRGTLSLTEKWRELYNTGAGGKAENSTAYYSKDAPGVIIRGWRIDRPWDGIRVSHGCDGFVIEGCWLTNARDDAIENDKLNHGTIRDCLLDGVFGGISLDPSGSGYGSPAGRTVTIDGVLLRCQSFPNDEGMGHTAPLKLDSSLEMPALVIRNTVIAIDKPEHGGEERMKRAFAIAEDGGGNVFLNLSDDPMPTKYAPPAGWLVLQGQAARDYWQQVRDEWVARHAGMAIEGDHVPDLPVEEEPVEEPPFEEPQPEPVEPRPEPTLDNEARIAALEAIVRDQHRLLEALTASVRNFQTALEGISAAVKTLTDYATEIDDWMNKAPWK